MDRNIWLMMVNQKGNGLYKKGYLGREVHEFEIEAAMEAQKTGKVKRQQHRSLE